ncbi:MAG: hypothetical protein HRT58_10220 [Crocinitomicaceae bacterium]|nr:hypothetical protein [Flavobacteriales bacterium]NQZ36030.1 hypothetical protein [Crocinitomicaceae bacterium]
MNKNLLFFLIMLFPVIAYSQSGTTKKGKLILASVSFEMGRTIDRYPKVDLDMMYDLTKSSTVLDRNLTGHDILFDQDVEGSRIGASIALVPFSKKQNHYFTNSEIRLGLFYSERGTHLSYSLTTTSGAFNSVSYSTRFKELSLNAAYVWKYSPKFAERFTLHGGLGLGLGSTFSDKTSVAEHLSSGQTNEIPESIFNTYEGNSSLFTRVYTPLGIDFALAERFDIGLESTLGLGLQTVYSGESYSIPLSGSLAIKLSYFF